MRSHSSASLASSCSACQRTAARPMLPYVFAAASVSAMVCTQYPLFRRRRRPGTRAGRYATWYTSASASSRPISARVGRTVQFQRHHRLAACEQRDTRMVALFQAALRHLAADAGDHAGGIPVGEHKSVHMPGNGGFQPVHRLHDDLPAANGRGLQADRATVAVGQPQDDRVGVRVAELHAFKADRKTRLFGIREAVAQANVVHLHAQQPPTSARSVPWPL